MEDPIICIHMKEISFCIFILISMFIFTSQELTELQDRYKSQTKELKEALSQRKLAMDEFTEINER